MAGRLLLPKIYISKQFHTKVRQPRYMVKQFWLFSLWRWKNSVSICWLIVTFQKTDQQNNKMKILEWLTEKSLNLTIRWITIFAGHSSFLECLNICVFTVRIGMIIINLQKVKLHLWTQQKQYNLLINGNLKWSQVLGITTHTIIRWPPITGKPPAVSSI